MKKCVFAFGIKAYIKSSAVVYGIFENELKKNLINCANIYVSRFL
ncbi:hypothetical protein [Clostridium sp. DMHC 10]|nr:hypothetical protein [Clostridium sp. DMHC 10]